MKEEQSYSIVDIKEADPVLEKHRKDVLEKYLEYAEKRLSILERLSIKLKSQKWDDHKAFIKY